MTTHLASRPWRMAFRDERALPSWVRGPREWAPLAREARMRRIEGRLTRMGAPAPASRVLSGLPRLRSVLSKTYDGEKAQDGKMEWRATLAGVLAPEVLNRLPNGRTEESITPF